jgi:hypothetical protein
MVLKKSVKKRLRFLLAMLATVIAAVGGSLTAAGASAAATTAGNPVARPSTPSSGHVAVPSYYVTGTGDRLSLAQVDAHAQTAAASGSLPVYFITSTNYGLLGGTHTCVDVGNYNSMHGIVCAELWAGLNPVAPGIDVFPAAEEYCQNSAGYANCYGTEVFFEVAVADAPGASTTVFSIYQGCGDGFSTPCSSNNRNYYTGGSPISRNGCNTTPGHGFEFWSVLDGTSDVETANGHTFFLPGNNFPSLHAIVCS